MGLHIMITVCDLEMGSVVGGLRASSVPNVQAKVSNETLAYNLDSKFMFYCFILTCVGVPSDWGVCPSDTQTGAQFLPVTSPTPLYVILMNMGSHSTHLLPVLLIHH